MKNQITDEAAKRLAVAPLPHDDPEVTGVGPVTTVEEGGEEGGEDKAVAVEDKAGRPGTDAVDDTDSVGRSNHGVAP